MTRILLDILEKVVNVNRKTEKLFRATVYGVYAYVAADDGDFGRIIFPCQKLE